MTTDELWETFIGDISFLQEASDASDEAHKLGLIYKGRGYWMLANDPEKKSVAKTIDGKLVKLNTGEEMPLLPPAPPSKETPPLQPELPDDHFHKLASSMHEPKSGENTFDTEEAINAIFNTPAPDIDWNEKQETFFNKQLNRIKNAKTNVDVFNAGTALRKAGLLDKEGWKALLKYTKEHRPDLEKYVAPNQIAKKAQQGTSINVPLKPEYQEASDIIQGTVHLDNKSSEFKSELLKTVKTALSQDKASNVVDMIVDFTKNGVKTTDNGIITYQILSPDEEFKLAKTVLGAWAKKHHIPDVPPQAQKTLTSSDYQYINNALSSVVAPLYMNAAMVLIDQYEDVSSAYYTTWDKLSNATQDKDKVYLALAMNAIAQFGAQKVIDIEDGDIDHALETIHGSLKVPGILQYQQDWLHSMEFHAEELKKKDSQKLVATTPEGFPEPVEGAKNLIKNVGSLEKATDWAEKSYKKALADNDGQLEQYWGNILISLGQPVSQIIQKPSLSKQYGLPEPDIAAKNMIKNLGSEEKAIAYAKKSYENAITTGSLINKEYWGNILTAFGQPVASSSTVDEPTKNISTTAKKAAHTLMSKIKDGGKAIAWAQKKVDAAPDEKTKKHFGDIITALKDIQQDIQDTGTFSNVDEPQTNIEPALPPENIEGETQTFLDKWHGDIDNAWWDVKQEMDDSTTGQYKNFYAAILSNLEKKKLSITPQSYIPTPTPDEAEAMKQAFAKSKQMNMSKEEKAAATILSKFKNNIPKAVAWAENKKKQAVYMKKKQAWDKVIAVIQGKGQKPMPADKYLTSFGDFANASPTKSNVPVAPKLTFDDIKQKYMPVSMVNYYGKYFDQAKTAKTIADLDHALAQLSGVAGIDVAKLQKDILTLRPDLVPPDTTKMDLQQEMEANVIHDFFQKFPMAHKKPEEITAMKELFHTAMNQPSYQDMKKVLLDMQSKGMIGETEFLQLKHMIPAAYNEKQVKLQAIQYEKDNAEKIAAEKKAMEKKLAALTPEKKKEFDDIFVDLETSGALKTLPQSNQTKIKNAIVGSIIADDSEDVMKKLAPLTGSGLNTKDISKIQGKVLNAFLDVKPYNPKSEPKTNTDSETRVKEVLNKWVDETAFGIANIPEHEQAKLKDAIYSALNEPPNKVNDLITSLHFTTSLLTPQIEYIRDIVKQERQHPGIFADVGKTAPKPAQLPANAPTTATPFGKTPTGKAKKAPKPSDRLGKKMTLLGIPADKQEKIKNAIIPILKKYANDPAPYLYGVESDVRGAVAAAGVDNWALRRKMGLFVKREVKNGLAGGYNEKGLFDKAILMKHVAAPLNTPTGKIIAKHYLANKTLVHGEQIDYSPGETNPPYSKHGVAHQSAADSAAAKKQADELQKSLPPKLYEAFQYAVNAIKGSSWWNKSSKERKSTNEALTKVANGPPPVITTVSKWVERGMNIPADSIEDYMKAFKVGQKTYLGPSEFSLNSGVANNFGGAEPHKEHQVNVRLRVKPPQTGKLNAIHVWQGNHSSHSGEYGVFLGMARNLMVEEVIKHIYNKGNSIAYEIIMVQDDPALLEGKTDEPKTNAFGLISQYWDEMGIGNETRALLIKYMNGPMNMSTTEKKPMNNKELNNIIRTELKKIIGESTINMDPYSYDDNFSNTNKALSPGSKLMQTPGAPMGGNISAFSAVPMSNECRLALKDWLRFAKACWKKFGNPQDWPKQYVQKSVELGQAFENHNRPQSTSQGYRP